MKKYFFCILTLMVAVACNSSEADLHIGSYNIRNENKGDGKRGNHWDERCPVVCDILNYEDFDVFGVQEAKVSQMQDLMEGLDGYGYAGVGRDDGKEEGEYAAIFYKKDRVKMLDWGSFWLSDTPEEVGSRGWDAALPRICTWTHLQKDGRKFWFFNMHMDHIGIVARRQSAKLIVSRIQEMCGHEPVVLTGDFNVDQENEIYDIFVGDGLLKDCYECARHRLATNGTFNSFKPDHWTKSRIDHLLVSPDFEVERFAVLTYMRWRNPEVMKDAVKGDAAPREINFHEMEIKTPSDHYPISAFVSLK